MSLFHECERCSARVVFVATVLGEWLCADCWRRAGRPFPLPTMTDAEIFEHETRVREQMTARGGADRYLVRAGKA